MSVFHEKHVSEFCFCVEPLENLQNFVFLTTARQMIVASVLKHHAGTETFHAHSFATQSVRNWQRVVWEDWNSSSSWQRVVWEALKRNDCYVSDWLRGLVDCAYQLRGKSEVKLTSTSNSRRWDSETQSVKHTGSELKLPRQQVLLVERLSSF